MIPRWMENSPWGLGFEVILEGFDLVQFSLQIDLAPGNAGHDGPDGKLQIFGDFLIRQPVVIEHLDGPFQTLIQFSQYGPDGFLGFHPEKFVFQVGPSTQGVADGVKIDVHPFFSLLKILQKQVLKNGKQPVSGFLEVLELMEIFDGVIEGFLGQVLGVMDLAAQAAGTAENDVRMRQKVFLNGFSIRPFGNLSL